MRWPAAVARATQAWRRRLGAPLRRLEVIGVLHLLRRRAQVSALASIMARAARASLAAPARWGRGRNGGRT